MSNEQKAKEIAREALVEGLEHSERGAPLKASAVLVGALLRIAALPEQEAPEPCPGLYQQRVRLPEPLTELPETGVVHAPWITAIGLPSSRRESFGAEALVSAGLAHATPEAAEEHARAWLMVEREGEPEQEAPEPDRVTQADLDELFDLIVRSVDDSTARRLIENRSARLLGRAAALRGEGDE